ncbi:hypothetical protein [Paenibacillus odorifer]
MDLVATPSFCSLRLLAKATVWAAIDERCANQAFNITNDDLFRWNEL